MNLQNKMVNIHKTCWLSLALFVMIIQLGCGERSTSRSVRVNPRLAAVKELLKNENIGAEARNLIVTFRNNKELEESLAALEEIAELDTDEETVIAVLVIALADAITEVRELAVTLLAAKGAVAAPALIETLQSEQLMAKSYATMALSKIGPDAVPVLLEATDDENPAVRIRATIALQNIGEQHPAAVSVVEVLTKLLQDEDLFNQEQAATELGEMGPAAQDA